MKRNSIGYSEKPIHVHYEHESVLDIVLVDTPGLLSPNRAGGVSAGNRSCTFTVYLLPIILIYVLSLDCLSVDNIFVYC